MATPLHIELHHDLDESLLAEVLALIDRTAAVEGHRPVGEHKYAHLEVGATGWTGVLACDGVRRLVGYAHLRWNAPGAEPRMAVEVVVGPAVDDREMVATRLLDAVEGVLARAGGGLLWLWVHRVVDAHDTLAARLGFRVQRELAYMTRPLAERPQPPPAPAGVELRPYRGEVDDAEFLRVNNAAFEGHPENGRWDRDEFAARRAREWFDPEGLLLAWRGDKLAGFHWTKWHGHEADEASAHAAVGEVYVLAVDPAAQGLGLGRFLLDAGLAHLHDRGCRRAVLYVDASSTAAVRLYASAGFEVAYTDVCYELDVLAAPGLGGDFSRPA